MKIAVLTSSRADYGIYLPLLRAMEADPFFDLHLIVFGSHLSDAFGYTVELIEKDGFTIDQRIEVMPSDDSPREISSAIGRTTQAFSQIWAQSEYDLVFALGDRFEMFAAVVSGVPFNIRFGHIHGGETTLGAIDDAFRHSITLMSSIHFACAEA
ncbi:MAG TPA: UDP-N-acetylglucosamine 2-epimerase, partial [Lentimicrobium sp.]|nr:UDP-N-acetylglucosamine 2-epimerase [Lentimicrobium sp.]